MKTISYRAIAGITAILILASGCSRSIEPVNFGTTQVTGINFIGMSVIDTSDAIGFYQEPANYELIRRDVLRSHPLLSELTGRQELQLETQLLRGANGHLLLMEFSNRDNQVAQLDPVKVNGLGFGHICYQVDQVTETYQKFLAAGATVMGDPDMVQLNPRNPVRYAYVRDPNRTMIEVEHVDVGALNLSSPPKNTHRMRHIALVTQDIGRAVRFYGKFLEQPRPRRLGRFFSLRGEKLDKVSGLPGSKLKMVFFQVRNMELEISQYVSHPIDPPTEPRPIDANGYNMIVFDVRDLGSASAHFAASGGSLVGGPVDFLGEQTQFGRDPDGNLIGLQATSADSDYSAKNFADNGI